MANEKKPVGGAKAAQELKLLAGEQPKLGWKMILLKYNALIILGLLIIVSTIMSPRFFTYLNLVNVLRQQSNYIVITMGMMVCMASGGVDLALAAVVGFACCMTTEFIQVYNLGIVGSLAATLVCCALIGAISGWLVAYLNMAPFIVTLCMGFNLTGVVYLITLGANRQLVDATGVATGSLKTFLNFGMANDPLIGLPWRFWFSFVMILITWYVMGYTSFGRLMLATGSNPSAARLAGIDIRKYRLAGLMIVALGSGMTGIIITASTGASAISTMQGDYTMIAMAASIIGGSSLEGGGGNVFFTVTGIFVMGLINNILNLLNIPFQTQFIAKAMVIIFAIYLRSAVDKKV
jgi:ribose transport system permease protein